MTRQEMLLVHLMEECNEVSQRAAKAIRFGLDDLQPCQSMENSTRLLGEIADLVAVIYMLSEEGYLAGVPEFGSIAVRAKIIKIEKFLAYSRKCGTLTA